jgi:hypothetical protein
MTSENLYVGIDVSKSKHDVAIINEQKQLCGRHYRKKARAACGISYL